MKLLKNNVVKKNFFFCLDDILLFKEGNKKVTEKEVIDLLSFMQGLEKEGFVELFLLAGLQEEKAEEKIKNHSLDQFFKKENIFHVNKEYVESKEELDKERHLAQLEKDPFFDDKFFKQTVLMNLLKENKITNENTALICHDIWFDAFYSIKFSGVDFFLVEKNLSERNHLIPEKINGLNYIDFKESDFKKIILGKFPKQDILFLETYIFNKLKLELFEGTKIDSLVKKSVLDK